MLKQTDAVDYLTNTESDTPPNLEPLLNRHELNNPLIHKIIASNEELIAQLMATIR